MNMSFALIEDKEEHRKAFVELVELYSLFYPEDTIQLSCPTNEAAFEHLLLESAAPNTIFIDIELQGLMHQDSGISLAKKMRDNNYTGEIIFLTSHMDYVLDGYGLDALAYLQKPANKEKLFPIIEKIKMRTLPKTWTYATEQGLMRFPYKEILFFSVERHKVSVNTSKAVKSFRGSLMKIIKTLTPAFHFCHRSYLVNLDHVQHVRSTHLLLSNASELPVSRAYYRNLLEEINRRIF